MIGPQRFNQLTQPLNLDFVLQAAGFGVWELDPATNHIRWDDRCRELVGLSKGNDLPYPQFIQFIHPEDLQRVDQALQWAINPDSGGIFDQTYRTVGADDGQLRWVRLQGQASLNEAGQVVRLAGVAQGITPPIATDPQQEASALQQAQRQQQIYAAITASIPDLVYVFDLSYRFTYANQALLDMWGTTWEQSMGKGLEENGYEPWHARMHEREIDQVVATKQSIRGEVSFPHARLGNRVYDYVFAPVLNQQGQVEAVAGTTRDITDILQAQQRLLQSEARFRTLIEEAPVATCLFVGEELRIELANEAMIAVWGKGSGVIGMPLADALPELRSQHFLGTIQNLLATGDSFSARAGRADLVIGGQLQTFYFDYDFKPLRTAEGQVYAILEMATDVTQQVLARQQLEDARVHLQEAVELAQLGTWSIDVATQGLTFSDRLIEWFGYDPNAQAYQEVIPILEAGDQARVDQAVAWALNPASDGLYNEIYTVIHPKTGEKRILHARGKTVFGADGKAVRLNGTAQDITLQRELQLLLEQQVRQRTQELAAANEALAVTNGELEAANEEYAALNEELEEANRLLIRSNENLQTFAYVASHDLQEPLRKIQQFGDLLMTRFAGSMGEELGYIERMQSAAGRMSALIKDLLNYSRISTQREASRPVPLEETLQQVLSTLELTIQQTRAQVSVGPLPVVLGDGSQLGQLFQNLLSNALKFRRTDQTGVPVAPRIEVKASWVAADHLPEGIKLSRGGMAYYRIDVVDNGVGFEEKYLDRIFQVFQRLHGKSAYSGTGIGLAICAKVVANHGGAITARSQPGEGATFSVYLPSD